MSRRIAVFGAGSIGAYVGGRLAAGGAPVVMIGRPRLAAEIAAHGLRLTDFRGADLALAPGQVDYRAEPAAVAGAGLVLVTVKSAATAEAAQALAPHLAPGALVISFQNGLDNAAVLARALPAQRVLAGMVPFNVVQRGQGRFHQGSEGGLEVADDPALGPWLADFARAGLPLERRADMRAVQWAKLLLNLNNAINALAGVPLKQELSQRAYRRCLALAQQEALDLLSQAGIPLARLTPVPTRWLPRLIALPDAIFRRLANRMLAIDPLARSSMWEDLEAGRATEVDVLNGEVVALAARLGRRAPVNERLVALVHEAEAGGRRDWDGPALLGALRAAR